MECCGDLQSFEFSALPIEVVLCGGGSLRFTFRSRTPIHMTSKGNDQEDDAIADLRQSYEQGGLTRADLASDPVDQFHRWFEDARTAGVLEPNAMSLATVDSDGQPSVRTVLLKGVDSQGRFVFFTNYHSRKAREIESASRAGILFTWKSMQRQISARGSVERVSKEESEEYFHSRPRGSQIGAWVSEQSSEIPDRKWLEAREAEYIQRFEGAEVPLPDFWGGFALTPETFEFWQGRPSRLHDRFEFRRGGGQGSPWEAVRLSP